MNDVTIKYETGDDTKVINVDIDDLILQLNSESKFCILDEVIINKNKIIEIRRYRNESSK